MGSVTSSRARTRGSLVVLNGWRVFIALWYLGGCAIHIYCAVRQPQIYGRFGQAPLYPWMGHLWTTLVLPHIEAFALLLAMFELTVAILLLGKGRAVTMGLAASLLFNLFLLQLGLVYPAAPGSLRDFELNRLPNLLFILIQAPLFRTRFESSFPAFLRTMFR